MRAKRVESPEGRTVGTAIGVAIAVAATQLVAGLLVGSSPAGPATYLLTGAFQIIVAVIACAWPAWKASGTDPMRSLRTE